MLKQIPLDVITMFETLSLQVRDQGWEHYSSDAILHRIRWHFHVDKGDRTFKCNNNWTPDLARWMMQKHPDMDGFFRTRVRRGDD
jgi:hypothetical protein